MRRGHSHSFGADEELDDLVDPAVRRNLWIAVAVCAVVIVAVEIVRALVGSVGLVASVPISTALAAKVLASTTRHDHDSELEPADAP